MYVWPEGRVGPAAVETAGDAPAIVRAACHLAGERAWFVVPSANWAALKELASLGFTTAGSTMFMASRPWPDGTRYLSSGGALG